MGACASAPDRGEWPAAAASRLPSKARAAAAHQQQQQQQPCAPRTPPRQTAWEPAGPHKPEACVLKSAAPAPAAPGRPLDAAPGAGAGCLELLARVQQLQEQLALLSDNPCLGVMEAAELLCPSLEVSLVSIAGFAKQEPLTECSRESNFSMGCALSDRTGILLATHGQGAGVLERNMVMRGGGWWTAHLLEHAARGRFAPRGPAVVHGCIQGTEADEALPHDWQALGREAGLRSFAAVLIGPPHAPLGALMVASDQQQRFANPDWLRVQLTAVATGLVQSMHHWQVAFMCSMLQRVDAIHDPMLFISNMLQVSRAFMLRATNLPMDVRLALLDEADQSKALVFASDVRAGKQTGNSSERLVFSTTSNSSSVPLDPADGLVVTSLELAHTLMESALHLRKARFVRSCTTYMQTSPAPARDVFSLAADPVASIVVVPLIFRETSFGAFYLTMDSPSDFVNLQDTLLGFVASTTLMLYNKLAGRTGLLRETAEAERARAARHAGWLPPPASSCDGPSHGAHGAHGGGGGHGGHSSSGAGAGHGAGAGGGAFGCPSGELEIVPMGAPDVHALACSLREAGGTSYTRLGPVPEAPGSDQALILSGSAAGDSVTLSMVSAKRLATGAMMEVVQSEIMRHRRPSSNGMVGASSPETDLSLERVIGGGGYGTVYQGTWKKITAAIKVFYARNSEREAMKDAVEMAVLNTVHHPNIVSVYACFTDMVEVAERNTRTSAGMGGSSSSIRLHYRHLAPGEEHEGCVCSIVVMEFCDGGTLRHAIKRGAFHRRMPSGEVGVDLIAILSVLQEVAEAVHYLHTLCLVHCDIKVDNILLKTDVTRPLGFIPRLADFGLVKILKDNYIRNRSGAGTVTHLAPEMLTAGSRITTAVDSFAFGVLMYEIYTGRRPYHGLSRDAILESLGSKQLRPTFPPGTPLVFARLAARCWAQDPSARPTSDQIVAELAQMQLDVEAWTATAGAATGAA